MRSPLPPAGQPKWAEQPLPSSPPSCLCEGGRKGGKERGKVGLKERGRGQGRGGEEREGGREKRQGEGRSEGGRVCVREKMLNSRGEEGSSSSLPSLTCVPGHGCLGLRVSGEDDHS